jgi:hypothetical protein
MVSVSKLAIIHILVLIAIATITHSFTTAFLLGQHFKASSRIRNIPGIRGAYRDCIHRWLFLTAPQYEPSRIKCAMNGVGKDTSDHQPKILQFTSAYGQPSDTDAVDDMLKKVKTDLTSAETSLKSVNDRIPKLEADILAVENKCTELVKILKKTKDALVKMQLNALHNKLQSLREKKKLLKEKESKLRDKKNLLRDEKSLLTTRKFKLSDETQGPAGELLCGSSC